MEVEAAEIDLDEAARVSALVGDLALQQAPS